MSRGVRSLLACGMLTALVLVPGSPATAASNVHAMKVFVSYADDLRGGPSLPSPWDGDNGVHFIGAGDIFDAGAIRIVNPSRQPLRIDDVSVFNDLEVMSARLNLKRLRIQEMTPSSISTTTMAMPVATSYLGMR